MKERRSRIDIVKTNRTMMYDSCSPVLSLTGRFVVVEVDRTR